MSKKKNSLNKNHVIIEAGKISVETLNREVLYECKIFILHNEDTYHEARKMLLWRRITKTSFVKGELNQDELHGSNNLINGLDKISITT